MCARSIQRIAALDEEVGPVRKRDRIPCERLGLLRKAAPGQDSRLHASPEDLRERVARRREPGAQLRKLLRFVVAPLREDGPGEECGCRREERLLAHPLEGVERRAQTGLCGGGLSGKHLRDRLDVRGRRVRKRRAELLEHRVARRPTACAQGRSSRSSHGGRRDDEASAPPTRGGRRPRSGSPRSARCLRPPASGRTRATMRSR